MTDFLLKLRLQSPSPVGDALPPFLNLQVPFSFSLPLSNYCTALVYIVYFVNIFLVYSVHMAVTVSKTQVCGLAHAFILPYPSLS